MAVTAEAVQIVINVTDANSGAAVAGVTQNLQRLGAAGAGVRQQLTGTAQSFTQFGTSGTIAGRMAKQSIDDLNKSMLSNVEQTRLTTEVFGVRLPRAMISLISQSKLAQAALSGVSQAVIGLATFQIGAMLFGAVASGIGKIWDHLNIVNKKLEDYRAEIEKTQQQEFGNTYSIETSRMRIEEASTAAEDFGQKAKEADKATLSWRNSLDLLIPGLGGLVEKWHALSVAGDLTDKQIEAMREREAANKTESGQYHEQRVSELGLDAAEREARNQKLPEGAQPKAKREAAIQDAKDKAFEERRFSNEQARMQGNSVAPDAGADKERLEVLTATTKANGELAAAQKAQAQELRRIHEEAVESGLRGSALYHEQEAAAIDDLKRRGLASAQAVNDIRTKFHNEEMKRLEDEQRETQRIQGEAALVGFKGIAHTQAQTDLEIGGIRGDQNLSDDAKDARVAAARQKMNAEILDQEQSFSQRMDSLSDQWAMHQVSGFARIRSEAQKASDDLLRSFTETYGQLNHASPEYKQGQNELNRGQEIIGRGAAEQTSDLARRNADETAQIEADARVKSLSAERQKTASIEAEYEQRLQKYRDELEQQEISSDDFNRRVAAAAQERDADMVEASRQAREKMAGEFTGLFKSLDHPMEALKSLGDKVAGEAAAALVQKLQQRGQHGAGAPQSTSQVGFLGDILGGFGLGGKKSAPSGTPAAAAAAHAPESSGAGGAMHIVTATISIGSASFAGMGGGFSGGGSAGGGFAGSGSGTSVPGAVGGSTGLLAPSGSIRRTAYSGAAGSVWTGTGTTSSDSARSAGSGMSSVGAAAMTGGGGGAGDASSAPAVSNFNAGSGAPPPPGQNKVSGILGDLKQGVGLVKQGASIFSGGGGAAGAGSQDQYAETQDPVLSGKLNDDGTFTQSGSGVSNGGMLGGGGIGANAGGAIGGALGLYSAYEGNGGFGGAASGAMSGMELGMAVGGPIGAAVGAAAGAIIGAIGAGGREKARVYDLKQVRPRLKNDWDGFQQGTMDYLGAYSDIEALSREANMTTNAMGASAKSYYQDTIKKEIKDAEGKLTAEQRAGRSMYTTTAAQYDIGTDSVPHDGLAVIHRKERIFPSDQNERITRALEDGAGKMPVQSSAFGGDVHLHVHTMDTKGVKQFLNDNKHGIRAAVNASFAENSGGADA